jgi:hypothetical protein
MWKPDVGASATLMLIGDLVREAFLKARDSTVHDTPRVVLFRCTSISVVGYLVVRIVRLLDEDLDFPAYHGPQFDALSCGWYNHLLC